MLREKKTTVLTGRRKQIGNGLAGQQQTEEWFGLPFPDTTDSFTYMVGNSHTEERGINVRESWRPSSTTECLPSMHKAVPSTRSTIWALRCMSLILTLQK